MSSLLSLPLSFLEPEALEPTFTTGTAPAVPRAGIAEWLFSAAQHHPHTGLRWLSEDAPTRNGASSYTGHEPVLTYPALLEEALHILGGLRARNLAPGAKVALLLERARDFIPAFWACVLGGYVPCPLVPIRNDRDRWTKHLAHINALLDGPLVLTTGTLRAHVADLTAVELDTLRAAPLTEPTLEAQPDQAALLVLTSGSTGNSKAVVLTHGNLFASMAAKNECRQLTAADVTLNWISFDHVAALLEAHLLPLYAGAAQLHIDSGAILADPMLFLRIIDRHRVSMTFAPNFLLGQITAQLDTSANPRSPGPLDLSCLRHIISGGEANLVATGKRFLDKLAPFGLARGALWPAFGMTETCAGSIYSREFPEGDVNHEFAALGRPIQGLKMRIADEAGGHLSPGESGELQLHGPMIFTHYYNNEAATHAAFTADGWFRTGDLGRIDAGRLRLVGRSKDSIIVSGVNYFSHELESALAPLADIERSFVATFPTRPAGTDTEQLVVAFTPTFALEDAARLKQLFVAIRNTTLLLWGFRPALMLPLAAQSFPKTSLGKIQRTILRQRLESGAFAAELTHLTNITTRELEAYSPPQGETETAVVRIFAGIFALDPLTVSATASFFDLGGTSLDIVKLKSCLGESFPRMEVPLATILQNPTPRALAAHVMSAITVYDPIVPLQLTGSKTPLFCVHAGSGEVLVFVSLAGFFTNERPFYALRARGFNPGESHFASFQQMVDEYVAAIRRRQPHGPYALAGYSYGGPVAFEIAKALEAQGERIAFLGSIDGTPAIGNVMARLDLIDSAVILAFFLGLIDRSQMQVLPAQLRAHAPNELNSPLLDVCAELLHRAPPERVAQLDLDVPRLTAWIQLSHALVQLGEGYSPGGTVESLSVFYAHPLTGSKAQWQQQLRQWDRFARQPPRYIEVEGEHHTLFDSRHVPHFQATLRAELDRACGDQ
jgi:acyl-CoA synthetase (AMP-forming)/AMP-acid ligase II/thioesterase domain-containing protein